MKNLSRRVLVSFALAAFVGLVVVSGADAQQSPPRDASKPDIVKLPKKKPDLVIEDTRIKWGECDKSNITFKLVVVVKNVGTAPSPSLPAGKGVRGQDTHPDGGWLSGAALPSIPPGGHKKVSIPFSAHTGHMMERAPHPWQVRVDPDGLVNESNEGNNERVVNITVPAKVCPWWRAKPDLIINSFKLKSTGSCGGTGPMYTFEVAVKNRGTVPAGPSVVKVKDTDGGIDWANGAAIPALPAGGIATVDVPIYYVSGIAHHIKFDVPHRFGPEADAKHQVDEYDELNNSPATATIAVTPTGCP